MTCSICGRTRLCEISRATRPTMVRLVSIVVGALQRLRCRELHPRRHPRKNPCAPKCVNSRPGLLGSLPDLQRDLADQPRAGACPSVFTQAARQREILGDGHGNIPRQPRTARGRALIGNRTLGHRHGLAGPAPLFAQTADKPSPETNENSATNSLDELPTSKTLDHLRACSDRRRHAPQPRRTADHARAVGVGRR